MYQVTLGEITAGAGGYACNSTICYSNASPATHELFKRLQTLLNAAAKKVSISTQIPVDGKIGSGTVSLAERVSDKAGGLGGPMPYLARLDLEGVGWKKESLARYADVIVPELANFVGGTPTTTPSSSPFVSTTATPPPVNPGAGLPATHTPNISTVTAVPQPPHYQVAPPPSAAGTQATFVPPPVIVQTHAPSSLVPAVAIASIGALAIGVLAFAFHKKGGL